MGKCLKLNLNLLTRITSKGSLSVTFSLNQGSAPGRRFSTRNFQNLSPEAPEPGICCRDSPARSIADPWFERVRRHRRLEWVDEGNDPISRKIQESKFLPVLLIVLYAFFYFDAIFWFYEVHESEQDIIKDSQSIVLESTIIPTITFYSEKRRYIG